MIATLSDEMGNFSHWYKIEKQTSQFLFIQLKEVSSHEKTLMALSEKNTSSYVFYSLKYKAVAGGAARFQPCGLPVSPQGLDNSGWPPPGL